MKCRKCKKEGLRYVIPRKRISVNLKRSWEQRTDFTVYCSKCKFKGDDKDGMV